MIEKQGKKWPHFGIKKKEKRLLIAQQPKH